MTDWAIFPQCLTYEIEVVETFRIPDPLWPGLGFFIAFIIGGILGAILARYCFKEFLRKKVCCEL